MKGYAMKDIFLRSKKAADKISAQKKFLLKGSWAYPLFVIAIFLISASFITSVSIRIAVSVILGFFPWKAAVNSVYSGNHKHLRTQILVLLQVLTTSVSSGYSIERSFRLIRPVIENTFGNKSALCSPLMTLENKLKVHVDLKPAINEFSHEINFPETIPVFHALAISAKIGNNSLAILRSSCQMLSEMNAVQSEISAANAGKNAEAAILCIMPFAITAALDRMGDGYLDAARDSKLGAIFLTVAFVLAVIASSLLLRFMDHKESDGRSSKSKELKTTYKGRPFMTDFIRRVTPTGFTVARHELFSELSLKPAEAYEVYLRKQLKVSVISFIASAVVLAAAGYNVLFAFPVTVLFIFAGMRDINKRAELKKEEIMQDIPLFLCLMCTLLEAGLQLPKAIEVCCGAFGENKSLSTEIKNLRAMILSGISASDAVERMSLRIRIPEAQAALLLVARYGRLGTSEVLNLLSLQASSCWNLCRNAARKKQEREALGLLFPMTLDFLCVLLVATTPAIISLGI